jgi:hypothetical protein
MNKFIQIISVFAFAVIFSVVSASAQSASRIKTDIPFDFKVGEKSYQAGSYEVSVAGTATGGAILILRDSHGNNLSSIVVSRTDTGKTNTSELVFHRYNDERFLAGVAFGKGTYSLLQSDAEKDAVKKNGKTDLADKQQDTTKGME